jgi:hypothetical protein
LSFESTTPVKAWVSMKHPPKYYQDDEAKENCGKFIKGEIDW